MKKSGRTVKTSTSQKSKISRRTLAPRKSSELHVTQKNLDDTRAELKSDIASLRIETKAGFSGVRSEMKAEFASVRSEMSIEFANVRSEMRAEFASVRTEMSAGFANMLNAFVGVRSDIDNMLIEMTKMNAFNYRTLAMVEEQKTISLYALDGYSSIDVRVSEIEKKIGE